MMVWIHALWHFIWNVTNTNCYLTLLWCSTNCHSLHAPLLVFFIYNLHMRFFLIVIFLCHLSWFSHPLRFFPLFPWSWLWPLAMWEPFYMLLLLSTYNVCMTIGYYATCKTFSIFLQNHVCNIEVHQNDTHQSFWYLPLLVSHFQFCQMPLGVVIWS